MTRPAIVIGLGGTGQWVLTFLKKELLEVGGGQMPRGVRLLSFDTTSQTTAVSGQGNRDGDREMVRAGAVRLTEGTEFIPIGDNVLSLAAEIADGQHDYLQWYPAKSFLGKLPTAAFATKEGSGQIRHMGRISVFRDLSAIRSSKVLAHLRAAIQALQLDVSRDRQLEIIIVGSLAGGTGAGMLVDMAILVRAQAAQLVQKNHVVRGFFVLPNAFTAGGLTEDRDMLARSFATWRELDRFMIVSERFGLRQLNYHANNPDLRIEVKSRVYDVSYMVDPARQTVNSLDTVKAEEGLFPALAHCLSAILDDKAGKEYTEFVSTNLAGKLAQLPRSPYHSAIGSYTLKVPVYYAREKFSHQLGLEVLDEFLAPNVNDKGRVVRVSEMHNREVPEGYAGRRAALSFMSASAQNVNGQEIPNTGLLPLIAEVRDKEGQREGDYIGQWARGGLTNVRGRVLLALSDISQDAEGKLIQRNIDDVLQIPIWREVPPSRAFGDPPTAAFTRIKNKIADVRHELYGVDDVEGSRQRGKYGKALDAAKEAQIARFRHLLQAWTLHNLNGQSEDPREARGGKIGYVRAFYEELGNTFHYFIGFLNKVRQVRNEELKLPSRAKEGALSALNFYMQHRDKRCWMTFWDDFVHPDAHRAQRSYLLAEQRSIDVRKDDILLDVLAETATEMKAIAQRSLEEIDAWISHLATGAPDVEGLYGVAAESLAEVNVNHELDKRLSKVSQLIGEHEYRSDPRFVAEAIERLFWQVEERSDGVRLTCGISFPSDNPDRPATYRPFRREGERPAQYNLNMLLKLAERPYSELHRERPMAREVMKVYESGEKLAEGVDKKAEPLYMTISTAHGPEVVSCYIRAHSNLDDETSEYFNEFEQGLRALNPNIAGSLKLVDSEDPHKLTIVRSDDLLPSTDFEMWHKCRDAYIRQVTDPHRGIPAAELHVFPAEINACYYEAEMPVLLRQEYRTLHPEVVALLEDRERFEMFFHAKALGYIRQQEDEGQPYWVYQLPGHKEPLYISVPSHVLGGRHEPDIFEVIHNFVLEGCDQRVGVGNALRVDWGELRRTILSKQRELGATQAAKLYRNEMSKGLINDIAQKLERRRAAVTDEVQRKTIGVEMEDLADLGRIVCLRAADSVQSFRPA